MWIKYFLSQIQYLRLITLYISCVYSLQLQRKFSAYFTHVRKIKICLCDLHPVRLCIPSVRFRISESIFMKPGVYIIAFETTSMKYFINPSLQSVCLYVYPPIQLLDNSSVYMFQCQRTHEINKNHWTHRFPCGPCRIKGEAVDLSVSHYRCKATVWQTR
jgi:hypothetical protein